MNIVTLTRDCWHLDDPEISGRAPRVPHETGHAVETSGKQARVNATAAWVPPARHWVSRWRRLRGGTGSEA